MLHVTWLRYKYSVNWVKRIKVQSAATAAQRPPRPHPASRCCRQADASVRQGERGPWAAEAGPRVAGLAFSPAAGVRPAEARAAQRPPSPFPGFPVPPLSRTPRRGGRGQRCVGLEAARRV